MQGKQITPIDCSEVRLAQHGGYIFVVHVAMEPNDVRLVQQSFVKLALKADMAASMFYNLLFTRAPDLRDLFHNDMDAQKKKFVEMLAALMPQLQNIDELTAAVQSLGRRHKSYDVKDEHYIIVGEVLLQTLERLFAQDFTPELRNAWKAAYNTLAFVMRETAASARPETSYLKHTIRGSIVARYGILTSGSNA